MISQQDESYRTWTNIPIILIRVQTVTCLDKKIPNERYRTWATIPNVG